MVLMEREELIAKATRISEIRRELSHMSALQKELRALEAALDAVTGSDAATAAGRRKSGLSVEDRVYQLVESRHQHDWNAEDIGRELGIKVPTVRAAFSKLRAAGKVVDTSRGRVQAKREPNTAKEEDLTSKAA